VTEPSGKGFQLVHEHDRSLRVRYDTTELLRYVYRPWDAQMESPRPYFHPLRTLGGDLVSLYRPHDHVWHKGIAWSLPNVGSENFWGGATFVRDRGYVQLPNNGAMRHRRLGELRAEPDRVAVTEELDWVTEAGQTWFDEQRAFTVTLAASGEAWMLAYATRFTNVTDAPVVFGSPTTEGRDNAGYGGLFWRGPRSFTGGRVYVPGIAGGDDLMGTRAPWLGLTGRHDDHGGESTLVFVDAPDNRDHPTKWFVRSEPFACVCPAPFFDTEVPVAPGEALSLRYAAVIVDGDPGVDGAEKLAEAGRAALMEVSGP
jgi:hypothetical protein